MGQQQQYEELWAEQDREAGIGEHSMLLSGGDAGGHNVPPFEIVVPSGTSLWQRHGRFALKVLIAAVVVALLVAAYFNISMSQVERGIMFFKQHPAQTLPLWLAGHSFAVAVGFPGMVPQTLCGFLFGLTLGLPTAWLATCLGQSLAFLLGRHLLKDCLTGFIQRKVPTFAAIEAALFRQGWKLLFLVRLAPVLPDNVMNYSLSITSLDWWTFTWVSATALVPYSVLYTYTGSASSNVMDILQGKGSSSSHSTSSLVLTLLSVVLGGCLFAYIVVSVKRALKDVLDRQHEQDDSAMASPAEADSSSPGGSGQAGGNDHHAHAPHRLLPPGVLGAGASSGASPKGLKSPSKQQMVAALDSAPHHKLQEPAAAV